VGEKANLCLWCTLCDLHILSLLIFLEAMCRIVELVNNIIQSSIAYKLLVY
jgi:hypothetical protein